MFLTVGQKCEILHREYWAQTETWVLLALPLSYCGTSILYVLVYKVLGHNVIKNNFIKQAKYLIFSSFFGIVTKFLYCRLRHSSNKAESSSEMKRNFITNVKHRKSKLSFPWTRLMSKSLMINFTVKIRIKAVLNIQHLPVQCLTFEQQDCSLPATPYCAATGSLIPLHVVVFCQLNFQLKLLVYAAPVAKQVPLLRAKVGDPWYCFKRYLLNKKLRCYSSWLVYAHIHCASCLISWSSQEQGQKRMIWEILKC